MRKTIFLDKKIEVLVVSAGGVGTTFLIEAISKYKRTNCPENTDGFKHLPIPPIKNADQKNIYVFGDPIMATLSLFRRQYHHTQSRQNNAFQNTFLSHRISLASSLEEYINLGIDCLNLERHFENWYAKYRLYEVFFIHYEHIHEKLSEICSYLNLPQQFIEDFPAKRERKSNKNQLEKEQTQQLEQIYHPFSSKLQTIEKCFVRPKGKSLEISQALLSKPYRNAYKKALKYRFFK